MGKLRVAVIGAGAAGLCAARHISAKPDSFEPIVFEKTERVGGTWVYTENIGKDKHGLAIHSSMYASLRTNLPKEVMAFPDFPFNSELPSFIRHTDVQNYIEQYVDHFDLLKYIQFCTMVECVRPLKSEDTSKLLWEVSVRDVQNKDAEPVSCLFDAVIVCNGHYSLPLIPELKGLDTFPGRVLHSHDYRHPNIVQDQTVLVIGAAASGIDISLDMSPLAKKIYLSHWGPRLQSTLPSNMIQVQAVKSILQRCVVFTDDYAVEVDIILFCSGYKFDFSFLHPECKVTLTDGRLTPLYKHIIHSHFPSLSFVGITNKICPFPHFNAQVQFALAALDGSMHLPSEEDMLADEERDFQARLQEGLPHRYAHRMGLMQWDYTADLLELAGCDQQSAVVCKIHKYVTLFRKIDLCNYKKKNFRITGDDTFEMYENVEQ